jgi:hypothetical protein
VTITSVDDLRDTSHLDKEVSKMFLNSTGKVGDRFSVAGFWHVCGKVFV